MARKRILVAALALLGVVSGLAARPPAVEASPVAHPYVDTVGMVHWIGEFEPGSDLNHYADWVLDQVGVTKDDWDARKPATGPNDQKAILPELDMIWLYLTPEEAAKANSLIGQSGLENAEATQIVSLPTPVEGDLSGGPLAAPGRMGTERTPNGVLRAGTPVDQWGTASPPTNGIRVAIVDTGIDARHDDLANVVVGGFNCTQDERGPLGYGVDPHGHGTWTGGAVGALHNNIYITSSSPGTQLLSDVVFGAEGSASGAEVLCGVNAALQEHADIISASLGGTEVATTCGGPSVYTNGWCKAADKAVVVVAAGNDGIDAINGAPANNPNDAVVTVGAIVDFDGKPGGLGLGQAGCGFNHQDDYVASFSDWGSSVDVMANGGCELGLAPGNNWTIMSGTSMSTPEVASIIANFEARFPGCRGKEAVATVLNYARQWAVDHPDSQYAGWFGAFAPPMIRYVDEDPLIVQPPNHPNYCAFRTETS